MPEKTYLLVQMGEQFAATDNRKRALRLAKREAKKNGMQVFIEERRPTMIVWSNGTVIGGHEND